MKRLLFLPLLTVVLTITAQNEKNAKEIELKEVTVAPVDMPDSNYIYAVELSASQMKRSSIFSIAFISFSFFISKTLILYCH